MIFFSILIGKTVMLLSRLGNFGSGSTWPGQIVLKLNPSFLKKITEKSKLKVVFVAGTNGKTTTSSMITSILSDNDKTVFKTSSGANLKNGIVSSFIAHANLFGDIPYEYAILEVDENILPRILNDITPRAIVVLNLFRDQLDRYGELDSIATKWSSAFQTLLPATRLFLNADDPLVANLGQNTPAKLYYFGLDFHTENKVLQHSSDSIYCPRCKTKLVYDEIYYSHLGHWHCPACAFARPTPNPLDITSSLSGTYNKYNAISAGLFALEEHIPKENIEKSIKNITAVFGRQEKIEYEGKKIQIFLSKNPTSFNQSIATVSSVMQSKNSTLCIVLNDNIPDGRDISWIWDIDFEEYLDAFTTIIISGHRAYDMALRLQYTQADGTLSSKKYMIEPDLEKAIAKAVEKTPVNETLFILPTYSAMLDVRKIVTGRKIL